MDGFDQLHADKPLEQPPDHYLRFDACQMHSDALVHAVAEAEMRAALAVDVEAIGNAPR